MTISEQVVRQIIRNLLNGEDYRIEVVKLIDAEFIQFAIEFFKNVVDAKFNNLNINVDWYRTRFLNSSFPPESIAINSGLNMKTIHNMYNSSRREIVISASNEHYEDLLELINKLEKDENSIDVLLTIKFKGVSVDLNLSESLIVINALAVKRAAIRGGLWSTAGKRVEKPLMQTLCKLYSVPENNYLLKISGNVPVENNYEREIDFYLVHNSEHFKCEVKLMGRGNPESADAVIARGSRVFIADKLSDTNKKQLKELNVDWVELRDKDGFHRFESVLDNLKIPHSSLCINYFSELDGIFNNIFK